MKLSERYSNALTYFKVKLWPDPVWSKVISGIILVVGGSIISFLYALISSLASQLPLKVTLNKVIDFFLESTAINNFFIVIVIGILCISLYFFVFSIFKKTTANRETSEANELPIINEQPVAFFHYRLASAFPGQRGLQWYESRAAVQRLKIVFREPMSFKSGNDITSTYHPVWWLRGSRAMYIENFKVLAKDKILIDHQEIKIKRIAVCVNTFYYKSFIYIEASADQPIGIYSHSEEDHRRRIENFGYSWEEYGLFKNKPIKREEFDDGAAVIKGKVIDTDGAELRTRYLSNYNFIIASHYSPYNSQRFERLSNDYFNGILKNIKTIDNFFDFLESFNRDEGRIEFYD